MRNQPVLRDELSALIKQAGIVRKLLRDRLFQSRLVRRAYLIAHPLSFEQKEAAHALVESMAPELAGDNLATYFWYARGLRNPAARRIRRRWRAGVELDRGDLA